MDTKLKEEAYFQKKERIRKKGNRFLFFFMLVFLCGYTFFLTSPYWLPPVYQGVSPAVIGKPMEENQREITVSSWQYSEKQQLLEVIIEINNLSLDGINRYKWTARDKKGRLKSRTVLETDKLVVIQVKLKKDWTEAAIHMNLLSKDNGKTKFDPFSFYVNDKVVKNVGHIGKQTKEGYMAICYESKIESYRGEIRKLKKKIRKEEQGIREADKKIKELKKESKYQSEDEKEKSTTTIKTIEDEKEKFEAEIEEYCKDIEEFNTKIALTKKLL